MALKVNITKIDGQDRVHPETMDLLVRLAQHRDLCDQCESAMATGDGNYCPTGKEFILELEKRPDCEFT